MRTWVMALAFSLATGPLAAQERALKILVGFPPGSSLDTMARLVGEHLRSGLGQTVVVENRPGVAGQLATDALKVASPDGSTILITPLAPLVTHPHVYHAARAHREFRVRARGARRAAGAHAH
jgi:tripartite-type tricarboxylate transporter receptor subunit TctC